MPDTTTIQLHSLTFAAKDHLDLEHALASSALRTASIEPEHLDWLSKTGEHLAIEALISLSALSLIHI